MYSTFNMGIGFIMIVKKEFVNETLAVIESINENAYVIGEITSSDGVELC